MHKILDWFELLRGVIGIYPVFMYYAIDIDSSLFLSESFKVFLDVFRIVSDVNLSSLFIVGEPDHRV
jgi:hypothetical protein